jgi:mevalonate pyrophosphate decarboxylase
MQPTTIPIVVIYWVQLIMFEQYYMFNALSNNRRPRIVIQPSIKVTYKIVSKICKNVLACNKQKGKTQIENNNVATSKTENQKTLADRSRQASGEKTTTKPKSRNKDCNNPAG